jgi:hypothetical protein
MIYLLIECPGGGDWRTQIAPAAWGLGMGIAASLLVYPLHVLL